MSKEFSLKLITTTFIALCFSASVTHSASASEIFQLKTLQVPNVWVTHRFAENKIVYFESQREVDVFWSQLDTKPNFPVDWSKQSVLAVFFPYSTTAMPTAAFVRADAFFELNFSNGEKKPGLTLEFLLNQPCFGIPIEISPAAFFVIDQKGSKKPLIDLDVVETKDLDCF